MTWEHVTTVEQFPVEKDTEIKLECEAGYTLQGSYTVTCKQDLQYTFGQQPICVKGKKCEILVINDLFSSSIYAGRKSQKAT